MNQINLQKQLDDPNGTVENELSNVMQPASQTTESPATVKKGLLNRIDLLASSRSPPSQPC